MKSILMLCLAVLCTALPARADSAKTVPAGVPVTFSLTIATGSAPTAYQWYKGLAPIPGATSAVFKIPAAIEADSGAYSCIVANAAGNASSDKGTLTVTPPVTKPGGVTVLMADGGNAL